MSKIRKKEADQRSKQFEIDIKFEKTIQFSGWFFLLALGAFLLGWVLLDNILELFLRLLLCIRFSLIFKQDSGNNQHLRTKGGSP